MKIKIICQVDECIRYVCGHASGDYYTHEEEYESDCLNAVLNFKADFIDRYYSDAKIKIERFEKEYVYGDVMHVYIDMRCEEQSECLCDECYEYYDDIHNYFYDSNDDYIVKNKVDRIFNYMVYSHGLYAFRGEKTMEGLHRSLKGIAENPEWEICCSDKKQQIGPFGIYVRGDVLYYSNIDLWSFLDENGHRVFDPYSERGNGLIHSPSELDPDAWDHSEVILNKTDIVGIWIKDWAMEDKNLRKQIEYLKEFASLNSLLLHICKSRH